MFMPCHRAIVITRSNQAIYNTPAIVFTVINRLRFFYFIELIFLCLLNEDVWSQNNAFQVFNRDAIHQRFSSLYFIACFYLYELRFIITSLSYVFSLSDFLIICLRSTRYGRHTTNRLWRTFAANCLSDNLPTSALPQNFERWYFRMDMTFLLCIARDGARLFYIYFPSYLTRAEDLDNPVRFINAIKF